MLKSNALKNGSTWYVTLHIGLIKSSPIFVSQIWKYRHRKHGHTISQTKCYNSYLDDVVENSKAVNHETRFCMNFWQSFKVYLDWTIVWNIYKTFSVITDLYI